MTAPTPPALGPGIRTNPGAVWKAAELTDNTPTTNPGHALMISASGAGAVTVTLMDNVSTVIVNVAVGDNIYPFSATNVHTGSATITKIYNLFAQ